MTQTAQILLDLTPYDWVIVLAGVIAVALCVGALTVKGDTDDE